MLHEPQRREDSGGGVTEGADRPRVETYTSVNCSRETENVSPRYRSGLTGPNSNSPPMSFHLSVLPARPVGPS